MLKIDKNIPLPSSKPSMRHAELYETAGDLEIGDSFEYVFPRKEGSSQKTSQAITVCGSLLRTRFTDRRFSI